MLVKDSVNLSMKRPGVLWGLCAFSFFHFSFCFSWKSSDHNHFQWGWNFDIDCQQGSKLSAANFTTLKKKTNAALTCRGSDWFSNLCVFKAPAVLEIGFMLASESPWKTEALGLLLGGDRETDSKVSLFMELIHHHPTSPPLCFTVLLFPSWFPTVLNLGGNAKFSTETFLNSRKMTIQMPRIIIQKHFSFCSFWLELLLF